MRDATKQVRDELTKRGVIWGKPAPEYWELLGGMPTRDYVTTVGDVNICETTAGDLVVENLSPEQAIAAVLGPRTCHNEAAPNCRDYWFCCSECEFVAHTNKTAINYCPNCGAKVVDE